MSLASDMIRGHTETIILGRLCMGDSYGYEINKDISKKTGLSYELKDATMYSCFRRLEEAGLISGYWGAEAGGARRRYYSVTARGRESYELSLAEWQNTKNLIDNLVTWGDD